jgi:hypothetical protein
MTVVWTIDDDGDWAIIVTPDEDIMPLIPFVELVGEEFKWTWWYD